MISLPFPDIRWLDQLELVQRDVAALLEHGLNPPAPESNANASAQPEAAPSEPGETPVAVAASAETKTD